MPELRSREDELIRESYLVAHESARLIGASVHIEVSEEVADYLRSLCTEDSDEPPTTKTFWGYPVVVKTGDAWDGFRIDIVTRKVIV